MRKLLEIFLPCILMYALWQFTPQNVREIVKAGLKRHAWRLAVVLALVMVAFIGTFYFNSIQLL